MAGRKDYLNIKEEIYKIAELNPCIKTSDARNILNRSHSHLVLHSRHFRDNSVNGIFNIGFPHLNWSTGEKKATNRYFLLDLLEILEKEGQGLIARKIYQRRKEFVNQFGITDSEKLAIVAGECWAQFEPK